MTLNVRKDVDSLLIRTMQTEIAMYYLFFHPLLLDVRIKNVNNIWFR